MTFEFQEWIETARERNLTEDEAAAAMTRLADGVVPSEEIADFLRAKAISLENVDAPTLYGLVRVVRERAIGLPSVRSRPLFDTCGTGGGSSTFNISTAAALVIASARGWDERVEHLAVAKHGNRAVASCSGSADVLEELGISVDLPPELAERAIDEFGFGFLFAQRYHRAFSHVQPVRKQLAAEGLRTAFNFVGPLANPADVTHQVLGIFMPEKLGVVAEVLRLRGLEAALCVAGHTEDGAPLDEISICGPTSAILLRDGRLTELTLTPEHFGLRTAPFEAIRARDRAESAAIIRAVVSGNAPDTPAEAVVIMNAAAALSLAGLGDWSSCADIARELIRSGAAERLLGQLVEHSAASAA